MRAEPAQPDLEDTRSKAGRAGHTPRTWNTRPPKASQRKASRWIAAAVALLGSVALVGLSLRPRVEQPVGSPSIALPSNTLPSTPQVTISLRSEPPNALLRVDNGPALTSPQVIIAGRSDELHGIVASLDGYEPLVRQIAFDQSQEIVLGLKPVAAVPPPPPPRKPQLLPRPPQRAPASTLPNVSTTGAPVDAQAGKKKKPKRPIDSANPFADP